MPVLSTRRWAVAVLTLLGATTVGNLTGPTTGVAAAADRPPNVASACGTWALQQVSGVEELNRMRAKIDAALDFQGMRGFSLRYPWKSGETSFAMLDEGKRIAAAHGQSFTFRFMAGRHTPASVFDAGAHHYVASNGERVPKPFSDSGVAGNPVFEQHYEAHVARMASWARANGVRLIHLSWYGKLWAEIDNGAEMQGTRGYSSAAWLEGHKRLVDIAARYAGPDLAVEFPLSGYWEGFTRGAAELVNHMVARLGNMSGNVFIQSNAFGVYNGQPTDRGVYHGMQMYDGDDYDWGSVYGKLREYGSVYVEVYVSSFAGARKGELQAEVAKFADGGSCAGGALVAGPYGAGYRLVAGDGGVFSFGDARFFGSTGAMRLAKPVVGMTGTPSGNGYWLVASDGGVFAFGDARFHGSTGALKLARPVVGMATTPSGNGYWLVASDGGVFAFGDARFQGSTGALTLAQPIVGMASTPSGNGYWLVASDGGVFAFGDARFQGSTGALKLARPVVGMASTPGGRGYHLVASDGGVFAFGDARFLGSTGAIRLAQPVVGMASTPSGGGYWMVASDGGVFAFGDARFLGSTGGTRLASPVLGMTARVAP